MTTQNMNNTQVRDRIQNTIESDRSKTVDVRALLNQLVSTVETRIKRDEFPADTACDATWAVLDSEEPYREMSHTERFYTVAFIAENFGVNEEWLCDDRRVTHADTWDDITVTNCERALYEIVHGMVTGTIEEDPHVIGEFNDSRPNYVIGGFDTDLREAPLRNMDVHNWVASLSMDVSTRLANFDEIAKERRTSEQQSLTKKANETESEAINNVIEQNAEKELFDMTVIEAASFLDALEDLYGMTGESAIDHEEIQHGIEHRNRSWDQTIMAGVLWTAMETAIATHREAFSDEFKKAIER